MAFVKNRWYSDMRENAIIEKDSKDHIKHIKISDKETGEIRYERWIVQYNKKGVLITKLTFKTEQEAIDYNNKCKEFLQKQRLSKGIKLDEKEVLDYPSNLLKQIGITESTDIDFNEVLRRFDDNFSKVSVILLPREKQVLIARFKEYKTLEEIGKDLHITRERVRQLEGRALKKLEKKTDIFLNKEHTYNLIRSQEYERIKAEMTYEIALEYIKEYEETHYTLARVKRELEHSGKPIESLNLSIRVRNALLRAGYKTFDDIKDLDMWELAKIRNLGGKSLQELKNYIESANNNEEV